MGVGCGWGSTFGGSRWVRIGRGVARLLLALACAEVTVRGAGTLDLDPDNSRLEAVVKRDRLRLAISDPDGLRLFRATWHAARVPARHYQVHLVELRPERIPGSRAFRPAGWRPVTVIGTNEWRQLSRAVFDQLTPAQPDRALYFQTHTGDGILYRDAAGQPHRVALADRPEPVVVERRASMMAMATDLARSMEQNLRRTHPDDDLFLILPGEDHPPTILDVQQGRCIIVGSFPNTGEPPWKQVGMIVGSLAIESHVGGIIRNPVSSAARLVNLGLQTTGRLLRPMVGRRSARVPPVTGAPGMDLDAWETWLDANTGTRRDLGSLELLIGGERFFPRFESAVNEATRHVHIRVGIFDRDDVAVGLADLLKARSEAIEVKVVYDRLSSLTSGFSPPGTPMPEEFQPPRSIGAHLQRGSAVRVRPFLNPWFSSDHAKVLLVDGRFAWLGGMNIGREYRYEWYDLMVEVQGPVVAALEREFGRVWAHSGILGDLGYLARLVTGEKPVDPGGEGPWIPVRMLPTKTLWTPLCTAVFGAIKRAQSHIYLENPYLFDRHLVAALAKARARGVDVRVVLPRFNDLSGAHGSNLVTANYLHRHGVRVYFYPGMTHAKALLVDGWACLGSANFNHLSLRLNQEQNIATSDPAFAATLRRDLFEANFAASHEMTGIIEVNWTDHLMDAILAGF